MNAPQPLQETRATCPYCGVGCGVWIQHDGQQILGVRGDPDHPANWGRLCTKGASLHLSTRPETRLLYPELRRSRDLPRARVSWSEALETAARRFAELIQREGPESVGFYLSGQLLTEDYYVFNKLVKGFIGSNNVDTNSRLCMSSAVAAYKQTLGVDAPPCSYEDMEQADCLLIVGSNMAYAHPIAFRRIEAAKSERPDMRLIVVDPRRTDTAAMADLHLAIRPGTDIWLFNAMLHVLIWEGLVDRTYLEAHTEGFAALQAHVQDMGPAVAARICGVPEADIVQAARWWGASPRALSLWCQGLNQSVHGTHNGAALIALSLATGRLGTPGNGPFSLTGQPNAMGGREVGGMANLLSAHRDMKNPQDLAEIAHFWGVPSVPSKPGPSAVALFEAVRRGEIKALWVACTNPAHSMPDQALIREALERCEFLVVQEAYGNTETAAYGDLLLPAATWGEKEGTVTNSERRITHVNPAVPPLGEARADWRIGVDFAQALGRALGREAEAQRLFPYAGPEAVFLEHAASTQGRDLDISGLTYGLLEDLGPQQWPFPRGARAGQARLYGSGRFPTPSGRARFLVPTLEVAAEEPDRDYPLRVITGRLRDQWHGMSRTGKVARLYSHVDEPRIELHPEDMARFRIQEGDLVRVSSRRGSVVLRAQSADSLQPGHAFVAMHWGRNVLNSSGANELTLNQVDPFSMQPELKQAAVRVETVSLPYQALFMRTFPEAKEAVGRTLEIGAACARWLPHFAYGAVFLAGREHPAVVLRLAHDRPLPEAWLEALNRLMDLDQPDCLSYRDSCRGIAKRALMAGEVLMGLSLIGETAAEPWLRDLIVARQPVAQFRAWLLAPLAQPPAGACGRGKTICNCLNVSESEIRAAIARGADVEGLKDQLKCGTSCGSCVPELKRMVAGG
ncbi:nitrate reductase [Azospira inquinata]|uniref:nitrate reductase (cytochrome) n=1 Tax=Azospira inquinata TaxID=2785627 RepID=A0A975SNV8_9RHOO|nr:nitrate reductase [Azospira inquinata]QWT44874.1 molybdopterin-dependent oxidoreductase [Azospira inquinata]QWT49795.1 molybdopterin-dependent oxidoreductase [Azospira inquinata]